MLLTVSKPSSAKCSKLLQCFFFSHNTFSFFVINYMNVGAKLRIIQYTITVQDKQKFYPDKHFSPNLKKVVETGHHENLFDVVADVLDDDLAALGRRLLADG